MIYLDYNFTTQLFNIIDKPAPYYYKVTYIIQDENLGKFYFGARWANTTYKDPDKRRLAKDDMGIKYFTSSNAIKDLGYKNFKYEILGEFATKQEAYIAEQRKIKSYWGDPLLLNKHYVDVDNGHQHFCCNGHSNETKENFRTIRKNKTWTKEERNAFSCPGSKNGMFGRKHTKSARKAQSDARRGCITTDKTRLILSLCRRDKPQNHIIYHWVHKNGNEELCTYFVLRKKYNLSQSGLSHVMRGFCNSCKGWSIEKKIVHTFSLFSSILCSHF